jgi:organic radical activating enzyme
MSSGTTTRSLCPVCYRDVLAHEVERDGAMWMTKTCPAHGYFEFMLDPDAKFWRGCQQPPGTHPDIAAYNTVTMVPITDRCNLTCAHCHRQPDNSIPDNSADYVVSQALGVPTPVVCLMGAEPTVRNDLPEIIRRVIAGGKVPLIYTNGQRIAHREGYLEELHEAGLRSAAVSIHGGQGAKVADAAHKAATMIHRAGWHLSNISFTVADLSTMGGVLDQIAELTAKGLRPRKFVIRMAARIGRVPSEAHAPYLSDAVKEMARLCAERGLLAGLPGGFGNNPYRIVFTIDGVECTINRWPTVETVDLRWCFHRGPWTTFHGGFIGGGAISIIKREGVLKGWYEGQRLVTE